MPNDSLNLSAGLIPPPRKAKARLPELLSFLEENKLKPGSTTGGRHNRGSRHYSGNAVDIANSGGLDLSHLNDAATVRGFKLRDERKHPKGQKVWGGAHWHLEAEDGEAGIDLSAGMDSARSDTIDLSAGLEPPTTTTRKRDAFAGVKAGVRGQAERPVQGVGQLRELDDPEASRVILKQRQVANEPNRRANARLLEGSLPDAEEAARRASEERLSEVARGKRDAEYAKNKPEIDRLAKTYRQAIRGGNLTGVQWGSETAAKGIAPLVEKLAGLGSVASAAPGAQYGVDKLRVHAQALEQAAREEGADRNAASKFAQDVTAGFIGSAPELAAMSAGVPAPLAFGAGSGLHAAGRGEEVVPAVAHGALTGAAFDLPVGGQGLTGAVKRAATVGTATTAIDLAAGLEPSEAIKSGATNALLVGVPEAVRLRPRGRVNEIPQTEPAQRGGERTRSDETGTSQFGDEKTTRASAPASVGNEPVPHHSITQSRRSRNVASGKRGQFKAGKVETGEPAVEQNLGERKPPLSTPPIESRKNEFVLPKAQVTRPLATEGLTSYRYRSETGGQIAIGAKDTADALSEASRSLSSGKSEISRLDVWDGEKYVSVEQPPSSKVASPPTLTAEKSLRNEQPSVQLTPRQQGQRSFPETVKRAGYEAESSNYDVLPNAETVAKANAAIEAKGLDSAVADLSRRSEFSAEDVAVGSRAIQEYERGGQMDKAIDTVETVAARLTAAGQTVQAAAIIARLSPEGTLLLAQRRLPKGKKLTVEQGEGLVAASKSLVEKETKVATLNKRLEKMQAEIKTAKPRIGTLQDRLAKMESEARARLAARTGVKGSQAGASTIPLDIADYAIIGAAKLAQKGVTLAQWTEAMVKEFGEEVRPSLKVVYRDSYKLYDDQRRQFASEREVRSATKANPTAKDIQAVINQRALARKDARTARGELRRLYADLSLTPFGKAKAITGDVFNVPRTLKSSVDLSAPRQGAMWILNHPVQGAKLFFGKQLKAMREVNYDRFVDELESDPDYALMTRSKLALTTTDARPHSLTGREEAFMSRIAGSIPGVKHSERAYTTFLDTARASWFKQLKKQAEAKAGKSLTNEQYEAIANFVNIGTGRGNLGAGTLNNLSPFLNAMFFAPKFAASKVQIFDPRIYARLPKGARATAMREATTYFGAMTTAALLLKYGFGLSVGLNPEESEFMKLRIGNTRYDLANGTGQYVTLAARLLRNAENKRTGEKDKYGRSFMENVDRFLRYKYSPPAAFGRNVWEGKNAIGQPTNLKRESVEVVAPLFLKEMYDAFEEEGLTGAAKTAPGFVGVGVNTYGDRPPRQGKRGILKF